MQHLIRNTVAALVLSIGTRSSEITYFAGVRSVEAANGERMGDLVAAGSLRLSPSDSTIVEAMSGTPVGDQPPERIVTLSVSGSILRLTDATGLMTGTGTLRGPAWHWTGWDVTARLSSGLTVAICDTLSADSLVSHQWVYMPGGQLVATIVDRLGRTDSAHFAAVRSRVFGR
jgi:hypothetical protein